MSQAPEPPSCAAFTTAARTHLRAATALATSYLAAHPGHRFTIVLVSDAPLPEPGLDGLAYLRHRDIPVPDPDTFHAQRDPDALAAALVPHAFACLLGLAADARLAYLAHDGWVYRRLDAVWDALDRHPIVLVPALRAGKDAMRRGPDADRLLRHGAVGDGLVALRRDPASRDFLAWWAETRDRVEDQGNLPPARALDPALLLFPSIGVLDHPGYHATRWNLHERRLALVDGAAATDGQVLAFLRFDGLTDGVAATDPAQAAVLEVLAADHDAALAAIPVEDTSPADSRLRLDNGVPLTRALHRIVATCVRRGIRFPAPDRDAPAFCAFAARPDPLVFGQSVAPLQTAVLMDRPDVLATIAHLDPDAQRAAFVRWLTHGGAAEEGLELLASRYAADLGRDNGAHLALTLYGERPVLREAYPGIFEDPVRHAAFGDWLEAEGAADRITFDAGHAGDYRRAQGGIQRVLDAYFGDPQLLARIPVPHSDTAIAALVQHFVAELPAYPMIDGTDLAWFAAGARHVRFELLLAALRYGPGCRDAIGGLPSLPTMPAIARFLAAHDVEPPDIQRVAATLATGDWIDPISQYAAFIEADAECMRLFPRRDPDTLARDRAHFVLDQAGAHAFGADGARWSSRILDSVDAGRRSGVNLCGPFDDVSGMGEAVRGLQRTLEAAGIASARHGLPARQRTDGGRPPLRNLYGAFDERFGINLTVANAAGRRHMDFWLPSHLARGRANVGTWVWETDRLPARDRVAADGLDLILSPSRFSAAAIAATVDVSVQVVPNALDATALAAARADRGRFGLPPDVLLLGFFFDPNSVIERKNPAGLLAAYRDAFGARRDVALVIKVNTPRPGDTAYQRLKQSVADLPVTWLEGTLTTADTLALMASLDAYVSLHRAEGFGLTLAEAMALGVPVVATGYSGNLDFMDADCALLVDVRICTTEHPHGPYPVGSGWAEPDIAHAAAQMQRLLDPALRARIGRAGQARVVQVLDIDRIAAALAGALAPWLEAGRMPGAVSTRPANPKPDEPPP